MRHTEGSFNGTYSDMATEPHVKEVKGPGGVRNVVRKESALVRWSLTRHITGEMTTKLQEMFESAPSLKDDESQKKKHKELNKSTMTRDEKDLNKLITHVKESMINPFDKEELIKHEDVLVHIGTGRHASPEVQASLLNCVKTGQDKMDKFVNDTLHTEGTVNFHDPLKRSKILTFASMTKKVKLKGSNGTMKLAHTSPELIFRRSLAISKHRSDLEILDVLSLPTGGPPPVYFSEDGLMRKPSNKADLMHVLEVEINSPTTWPAHPKAETVLAIDFSVLIQKLFRVHKPKTFDKMGDLILKYLISACYRCTIIIVACDVYCSADDTKEYERRRRNCNLQADPFTVIGASAIPNWSTFGSLPENKNRLNEFLCVFIEHKKESLPEGCELLLGGGFSDHTVTKKITCHDSTIVPELKSIQLEADCRIFSMLNYPNDYFKTKGVMGKAIIYTIDSDIGIIATHHYMHYESLGKLWIETGSSTGTKDSTSPCT